ncbi:MAG: tetratricopeptide repeat protein [Deltaproteobacteria bacterium]|nr:tetratricopeptide repeat protein [Deltaproteobacteria bacterium]
MALPTTDEDVAPPTQTRALLLTDVVDSTMLSEQLGDVALAALWTAHDRLARELLPLHRGLEIDKTDGFLLLFEEASDAVAYAVAYHRALRSLDPPLKARAGLHVGDVVLTETPAEYVARGAKPLEVEGIAKPTAARVMSVAAGGQTLLTGSARAALGGTDLRLESHGHWRMKGLAEPIELFEVGDDDAPFFPPPDAAKVYRVVKTGDVWLPVKDVNHSLPTERDAFVGRRPDLHALAGLLDGGAHLVSVLGIGGTGKTRLVTRFGWTWLGDYPGGVWFCDLSEARGLDGIVYAVARALNVPLGKTDPVVQLGHAIAGRGPCLVVLDNFEQVSRHAAETLGTWLDRAHEARFVVTTREVLGLPGEQTLPLAPLRDQDSVELFTARARAAKRGFVLSDAERPQVEELVKLLDGLPLAIELAAARVRVMPPKKLLARMSQRFKLLASSGGRHTRQATLRATLDWSWDLLSGDEQAGLAQLSVFEGGFTLEACEEVLALEELWPMDAVQGLVDKSLVRQVDEERFDLLVSVQEYAVERLDASGARKDAEARHAAYFAKFGTLEAVGALDLHGGVARRRALTRELDNIVAACRRCVATDDAVGADPLLEAGWAVLQLRGPLAVAVGLAERVISLDRGSAPPRGAVGLRVLGEALMAGGRGTEALTHLNTALAMYREGRDPRGEALVLGQLGLLHRERGRMDEARAHYDAAREVLLDIDDRRGEGWVLNGLGILHMNAGRPDEAGSHYEAALEAHREVGNRRGEGNDLSSLGNLYRQQGRMDEARAHYDTALRVHREVGNRYGEGVTLGNLAILHSEQGRLDEAGACFDAALTRHREIGNRQSEGIVLGNLGTVHLQQGRVDEARAHCDTALGVYREVGLRWAEGTMHIQLGTLDRKMGRMDEARAHYDTALGVLREVGSLRMEGAVLTELGSLNVEQGRMEEARDCVRRGETLLRDVSDQLKLAMLLCTRTGLEHADGNHNAAHATLAEVEQLADSLGAGPESALGKKLEKARLLVEGS